MPLPGTFSKPFCSLTFYKLDFPVFHYVVCLRTIKKNLNIATLVCLLLLCHIYMHLDLASKYVLDSEMNYLFFLCSWSAWNSLLLRNSQTRGLVTSVQCFCWMKDKMSTCWWPIALKSKKQIWLLQLADCSLHILRSLCFAHWITIHVVW